MFLSSYVGQIYFLCLNVVVEIILIGLNLAINYLCVQFTEIS